MAAQYNIIIMWDLCLRLNFALREQNLEETSYIL